MTANLHVTQRNNVPVQELSEALRHNQTLTYLSLTVSPFPTPELDTLAN